MSLRGNVKERENKSKGKIKVNGVKGQTEYVRSVYWLIGVHIVIGPIH
jgi:hypothetical protein